MKFPQHMQIKQFEDMEQSKHLTFDLGDFDESLILDLPESEKTFIELYGIYLSDITRRILTFGSIVQKCIANKLVYIYFFNLCSSFRVTLCQTKGLWKKRWLR